MLERDLDRLQAHRAIVRRLYIECINEGRLDMADQLISADSVPHSPQDPEGQTGLNEFTVPVVRLLRAFPDLGFTVEDLIAEGDRVAVRWTWEGTHRGPLGAVPATGKRIIQHGDVIHRIRDSMIVESWAAFDRLTILQQLGAVPPTGTPAGGGGASSGKGRNEPGSPRVEGSPQ